MYAVMWESINSDDSLFPFALPLAIWVAGFSYCYLPPSASTRPTFHKWQAFHNFHNFGGMGLAFASLYFDDDTIFNERISILWTFGYFCVDLVDTLLRRDVAFSLHAILCLVLGMGCYTSPIFRLLRINSKALLCELSSPLMHVAKRTREPLHFLLFAIVFFLCRIVWLPYFLSELRFFDLKWFDFRIYFLVGFYLLNLYWFYKIVRLLVREARKETKKKKL